MVAGVMIQMGEAYDHSANAIRSDMHVFGMTLSNVVRVGLVISACCSS